VRKMEVHTVADLVRLSQDLKSQAQA
jgi:hypothetical protein